MTEPKNHPYSQEAVARRRQLLEQAVDANNLATVTSLAIEGGLGPAKSAVLGKALTFAVKKGHAATVEALIRNGADPSWADRKGDTPVYWAVQTHSIEILKILLSAGANPNGAPGGGIPMLYAVMGSPETLEPLMQGGADLQIEDEHGSNALHLAVKYCRRDSLQILMDAGFPIDKRNGEGLTALHMASHYSNPPIYQLLIDHGADVHLRAPDGMTPALLAAAHGQKAAFDAFVRHGADPLARDVEGLNALDLAIGKDWMAMHLLQHYPALTPSGDDLNRLFVQAVRSNCPKTVVKLAELGADIGQKPLGRTLLQCAPRDAEELKRVLRALKSGAAIGSAMDADPSPATPAASSPAIL